jgi:hypothetical protein
MRSGGQAIGGAVAVERAARGGGEVVHRSSVSAALTIHFARPFTFGTFGEALGVPFPYDVSGVVEAFKDADISGGEGDSGRGDECPGDVAD